MRIAQVAPIAESVPPILYGGVERVVSYLTEDLVASGHQVTLFASGDSSTSAELHVVRELASRDGDYLPFQLLALESVIRRSAEFDVIHFHVEPLHFPFVRFSRAPIITTLHGRLDIEHNRALFEAFPGLHFVSVSDAQRAPLKDLPWLGTVHHGLPDSLYRLQASDEGYLAFLGRLSPEKDPVAAIEIARMAGMTIKLAAKIDRVDEQYVKDRVRPLLSSPYVEYLGEIDDAEKQEFLGRAGALLCPGRWPEPFGIVCIEAFACGTPVIAARYGAFVELIENGKTGFLVDTWEEAAQAAERAAQLDRRVIRREFERRFSSTRMMESYVRLYKQARQTASAQPEQV